MSNAFIPNDRETQLAGWAMVLSLDTLADTMLSAQDKAAMEWNRTPWWRFIRRRRAERKLDMFTSLYWEIAMKAQEQDRARA